MMLSPEVIALLTLDVLFLLFGSLAFVLSSDIARHWNIALSSEYQYALEKKAVLVATIIQYIFYLKLPLFLFFIFTADTISTLITGAMCATGVVNSVDIGFQLFGFKIINLYLFAFWLLLHSLDMKDENLRYTRAKFIFFMVVFISLACEVFYDFYFFNALNIDKIVSCCGTLFSVASTASFAVIFTLEPRFVLIAFYGLAFLQVIFFYRKAPRGFLITHLLFIPVAIVALILYFETYVYELPTHHCPFCLLQKEYYYVGYFLYTTLFLGTFFGIGAGIMSLLETPEPYDWLYRYALFFTLAFILSVSAYPLIYFYRNGVWL